MQGEGFQATFCRDRIDKEEMWYLVEEQIFQQDLIEDRYAVGFRKLKIDKLCATILRQGEDYFGVEGERLGYDFSEIKYQNYNLLSIKDQLIGQVDWSLWVARLAQVQGFIQAFYEDNDYAFWQHEKDINWYETFNHPHDHLRKRKGKGPPPFDKLIIAVEDNPGRYVVRNGFVEAVAAEMWLGPEFWARTGADRAEVLACEYLQVEEQDNDVLHLKAGPRSFTEETGPQAEIQHKMRRLLFPNSVDLPLSF
ncbi:MAG: hypothetical protein JKY27_07785 [Magnetovibrio sp.]|nr:hypothetical protein [Magnetovibrio sp.]